ncbi:MAG: hypothetical protein WAO41_06835 [Candidatus Nanopelagicales bacterium]
MTEQDLQALSGVPAAARLIRIVLALGALLFIASGIALIIAPGLLAEQLGLTGVVDTTWTLQMLGAALVGLSGQMWLVRRAPDHPVLGSAVVMLIAGGLMVVLTLTLPGDWTLLRWVYLGVGIAFWLAYAILVWSSRRRAR